MLDTKRFSLFVAVCSLCLITLLAACSAPVPAPMEVISTQVPPTNTDIPPTVPPPTSTPVRTDTPSPTLTEPPPTAIATLTSAPSDTPTATPTVTPIVSTAGSGISLPSASRDNVWIFFIQEGTGGPICGDSAIAISSGVEQSGDIEEDLTKALRNLFAYQDEYVAGLYNPLSRSNLRVNEVNFDSSNGLITVDLTGTYKPSGDKCDNTRVKAQVWQTIRQWRAIKATNIYLNGIPFGDRVSND